jgi:hypothetical protein
MISEWVERVDELCNRHDHALTRKARHGCYKDDYILKADEWRQEVVYFIENVLKKDVVILSILSEAKKRDIYGVKELLFNPVRSKTGQKHQCPADASRRLAQPGRID